MIGYSITNTLIYTIQVDVDVKILKFVTIAVSIQCAGEPKYLLSNSPII